MYACSDLLQTLVKFVSLTDVSYLYIKRCVFIRPPNNLLKN